MKYSVLIRDNATGEERMYPGDVDWDPDGSTVFYWTEGNAACDCNRYLSFLRAGGPGPANDPHWNRADRECGRSAYSVPYALLEDGTKIELDDD